MSRQIIGSVILIVVGIAFSLACCWQPRRPVIIVPPPIIQQPIGQPPGPGGIPAPFAQKPLPNNVQQLLAQNLGANNRAGALAPGGAIWARLRQAVDQRQYNRLDLPFGAGGNNQFLDTMPGGGVLIGFFTAEDGAKHVAFVQPIYLTAQGEKTGQHYGEVLNEPVQCLKAKRGFAVGALQTRTGAILDGFTCTFMKVEGERLNTFADAYASPWIGGEGGGPHTSSSMGALVIGIHGSINDGGFITPVGSPSAMNLVTLP
jgi:hypothetical protein